MRRAIRKFVSTLEGRNKWIFFILLILLCIIALSLGIYVQFFYKYSDTDPLMIGINIGSKKTAEEYALLKSNFNELFKNELKVNAEELKARKIESKNEIVYTAYNLVNEDETYYKVDAQIPMINIDSDVAKEINTELKNEYYNKSNAVMRQSEGNTVYKVSYVAYVNSDIVSLAIRASLKEEGKSEKVSIKTYNYSISREDVVSLDDLISLKGTTKETVQDNINHEIKTVSENLKAIASEYGTIYERDINSDIYKVESTTNYFLTDDGYVYIVYAYGNDDDTNEMDIVIF